jgi:hypothetical protein
VGVDDDDGVAGVQAGWQGQLEMVDKRLGAPKQLHKQGLAAQSSQDTIGAVKADRGDSENSK